MIKIKCKDAKTPSKMLSLYPLLSFLCAFAPLRLFFLSLLSVVNISYAVEPELVVRLETEDQLFAVSIPPFITEHPGLSDNHIKEMEHLLHFDFDNNGMTKVMDQGSSGAMYTIRGTIKGHHLNLVVTSCADNEEIRLSDILLSGYEQQDRNIMHQVADKIHEALFGMPGVASTRLLFTIKAEHGQKEASEVWESDYDGGNLRQVTRDSGYSVTPSYIPPKPGFGAGSFVYVSYKTGQPKINVASLNDGSGRPLMDLSGNQLMPAISRQRDKIAFISDVTGNPDLFLQDFDPENGLLGKPRHLYTSPFAVHGTPTFSPDGTRIAFVSNKSGTPRIYVIKIPPVGTPLKEINPLLISKFTKDNTAPSWSFDGTKIAYCSRVDGIRQIMVYDILTGLERQLSQGPVNKENPVWAPNSLHLVYNTSDSGNCQLYLINIKQPYAIKITSGPGEKRFPSWEPRTSI